MLNCYSRCARDIICEALRRNFNYPDYGWILYGWYPDRWWTEEVAQSPSECTDQELENFLRKSRALVIQLLPEPDDYNQATDADISADEFNNRYDKMLEASEYDISTVYALAFDTVWTLALVLNYTEKMRMLNESKQDGDFKNCSHLDGKLVPLNEFTYSNAFMGCVMKETTTKSTSLEFLVLLYMTRMGLLSTPESDWHSTEKKMTRCLRDLAILTEIPIFLLCMRKEKMKALSTQLESHQMEHPWLLHRLIIQYWLLFVSS
jgi:hypothetical protein